MTRYEQVADDLRAHIRRGTYAIGANLPTYAELTATYGVGRGVISSALQVLEREGLVRIVERAGIRVLNWRLERRRITRGQTVTRDPHRSTLVPARSSAPPPPWPGWTPPPELAASGGRCDQQVTSAVTHW